MKLHTNSIPVQVGGKTISTSEFGMSITATTFELLTSGLYSSPIKAIIRELSTNAVDAHRDALKRGILKEQRPFDVCLPNEFTPSFRIRDYGTGMSEEDVKNTYVTFFKSTKANTNDDIGAMGLGSKSPLGYTSNFTVNSFYNGFRYSYFVFLNDGIPSLRHCKTEESPEPPGLEIIVPCMDSNEYGTWHRAAKSVYAFFDLAPNLVNDDASLTYDLTSAIVLNNPSFTIYDSKIIGCEGMSNLFPRNTYFALMGNILYPINNDDIFEKTLLPDTHHRFVVVFNFDIGDIMFSPSRESLNYNKQTVEKLTSYLSVFATTYKAEILKQFINLPTQEKIDKYNEYFEYSSANRDPLYYTFFKRQSLNHSDPAVIEMINSVFIPELVALFPALKNFMHYIFSQNGKLVYDFWPGLIVDHESLGGILRIDDKKSNRVSYFSTTATSYSANKKLTREYNKQHKCCHPFLYRNLDGSFDFLKKTCNNDLEVVDETSAKEQVLTSYTPRDNSFFTFSPFSQINKTVTIVYNPGKRCLPSLFKKWININIAPNIKYKYFDCILLNNATDDEISKLKKLQDTFTKFVKVINFDEFAVGIHELQEAKEKTKNVRARNKVYVKIHDGKKFSENILLEDYLQNKKSSLICWGVTHGNSLFMEEIKYVRKIYNISSLKEWCGGDIFNNRCEVIFINKSSIDKFLKRISSENNANFIRLEYYLESIVQKYIIKMAMEIENKAIIAQFYNKPIDYIGYNEQRAVKKVIKGINALKTVPKQFVNILHYFSNLKNIIPSSTLMPKIANSNAVKEFNNEHKIKQTAVSKKVWDDANIEPDHHELAKTLLHFLTTYQICEEDICKLIDLVIK